MEQSEGMTHASKKRQARSPHRPPPQSAATRLMASLRSLAGDIWHLPEPIMHVVRRAAARRQVVESAPIGSALFICHGNVCRSPFAAAFFSRAMPLAGPRVSVRSAGFIGPGRQPPAPALSAASRRNLDLTTHRSALITGPEVGATDLVVVMSVEQAVALRRQLGRLSATMIVLGDLDPRPIRRRTILDPWGGDDATFDESYDRIERCITELVLLLTR